ncbi:MAG: chaperone modulator CbpM [Acidimicrobiia bacterium]
MSTALTRPVRLDLQSFSRAVGLHPEIVHHLIALGLLETTRTTTGELWFAPDQVAAAARIRRLRAGFGLNYAAIGLVVDLLDRVARLEAALRARAQTPGGPSWT